MPRRAGFARVSRMRARCMCGCLRQCSAPSHPRPSRHHPLPPGGGRAVRDPPLHGGRGRGARSHNQPHAAAVSPGGLRSRQRAVRACVRACVRLFRVRLFHLFVCLLGKGNRLGGNRKQNKKPPRCKLGSVCLARTGHKPGQTQPGPPRWSSKPDSPGPSPPPNKPAASRSRAATRCPCWTTRRWAGCSTSSRCVLIEDHWLVLLWGLQLCGRVLLGPLWKGLDGSSNPAEPLACGPMEARPEAARFGYPSQLQYAPGLACGRSTRRHPVPNNRPLNSKPKPSTCHGSAASAPPPSLTRPPPPPRPRRRQTGSRRGRGGWRWCRRRAWWCSGGRPSSRCTPVSHS